MQRRQPSGVSSWPPLPPRDLVWDGCLNVRDLGGHPTTDAGAVRAVARAPEGGVVVHCVGGKDRTGLLTAFLLHLAGVPDEDVAADYALSEERLRPRHEAWFEEADSEEELERLRKIAQTPPGSMLGVFRELERRYGSVEGYLRSAGVG